MTLTENYEVSRSVFEKTRSRRFICEQFFSLCAKGGLGNLPNKQHTWECMPSLRNFCAFSLFRFSSIPVTVAFFLYGNLDESRIARLDEIGIDWDDLNDRYWKVNYQELLSYKEKYGDIRVPATYVTKNGIRLGCWISNLRTYRKNGFRSDYLTKERIADLDALGICYDKEVRRCRRSYAVL